MLAVSRHGLVAQPHRVTNAPPPTRERPRDLDGWPRTARGMLRALRREVQGAAQRGIDWREVVTSLRADTGALWQSLPMRERARFLAHVRPYWEIHRHRAAPVTADGFAKLIASGRLILRAGHVLGYRGDRGGGVDVRFRPRGSARVDLLRVARVVNCTGPQTDLRRVREPLVRSLLAAGLARPEPLGLGLDVTDDGAVLDATGRTNRRLFAVGPLCKGRAWEMTAVPELRGAAARLGHELGCELATASTRRPGA
jgi:uncharacterized NAD(P)/FAD-binding protein YdhS